MGSHLIDGQFQSDKYPTTPRGFVPLKCTDKDAQPVLWAYAQAHRARDPEFASDLEQVLMNAGFVPPSRADAKQLTEKESIDVSNDVLARQRSIDESRALMATEIVDGQNIQTVEEGRRFAHAWIVTAAQHASNEEYYRGERDKLLLALGRIVELVGAAGAAATDALRELSVVA